MATVEVRGNDVVVVLSSLEKLEAFHGDIVVAISAVRSVRAVENPWPELRGVRAPGTGVPGKIAVGTRRGSFGKDFAVVHGRGPALVLELTDAPFQRIVLTVDQPGPLVAAIDQARPR